MRSSVIKGGIAAAIAALSLSACSGFSSEKVEAESTDQAEKVGVETELKVAFNQTETHPQYQALVAMGERLAERTDGRYGIKVFPNETLGSQKDAMELVQAGSIDLAMVTGSLLQNLSPDFVVFNLPYTFDSQEHQLAAVNDETITGDLFHSIDGVTVLGGFTAGARSVYNSQHPITTPEDLAGMKIRVIESDTNLRMMELMGGTGTPMGQGEVYTAIQSGVIDGGENNESIFANLKHAEIAPYFSYTRHLMFPDFLIGNSATLDKMSDADRAAFTEELSGAIDEAADLWGDEIEKSTQAAIEAGAQFNEVDIEAFRAALAPLADEALTTDSARELYATVRAAAPAS